MSFNIKITTVDMIVEGEIELDCSVARVWPSIMNYTSWQNFTHAEHISGVEGGEGEIVLLCKREKGTDIYPPYYARTMLIEPEKRFIWKTYFEQENSAFDFSGIVDFRLKDQLGSTLFTYNMYYEYFVKNLSEEERVKFKKDRLADFNIMMPTILGKLKTLVEQ